MMVATTFTDSATVDPHVARAVLALLTGRQTESDALSLGQIDEPALASWLVQRDLGALAESRLRDEWPEVADLLRSNLYATAAQNTLHWRNLHAVDNAFASHELEAALLKGAALAGGVYEQPEQRPMSDVDLWVPWATMGAASRVMGELGFRNAQKAERPLALQALSGGELQYTDPDLPGALVELHLSPFPGWWLQRTAVVDTAAIWARREPLAGWRAFSQPAPEDMVIQLAVHMSVNHQFGLHALRSLVDIALTAQARAVDWRIVAQRARQWRVATAVWLVLYLLQALFNPAGLADVLPQLQPPAWRCGQLLRLVSPERILAGEDMRNGRARFWLLLLLVDRRSDAARLVYRALWPEKAWLAARYDGQVSSWQHLRRVVREGDF